MTENGSGSRIRVFDETGREIGETYPKRARGLVKRGRAVLLSDPSKESGPDACPDLLILLRNPAGESDKEDTMNDNNNTEQRINDMIARFREEMAKAREIAEQAAKEAAAVLKEAEDAVREAELDEKAKDFAKEAGETLRDAAQTMKDAVNGAKETAGDDVKDAADAFVEGAKRAYEEAEAKFNEARRAYEDAKRQNAGTAKECGERFFDKELCDQAKANLNEIAREAKEAAKVAWEQIKKGWNDVKNASSGSVEWLKEETKDARASLRDAFHEMKEGLRSMMDDIGDAGEASGEEESAGTAAEDRDLGLDLEWRDESEDGAEEGEADLTAAEAADAARRSIEAEMEDVRERIGDMLTLVRKEYDAGNIGFDKYVEYTDKYTAYLHDRLVELRDELKK